MNTPLISIKNLSKSFTPFSWPWRQYKKTKALVDINLSLHKGDRVALLGTNGAGKTTLLKILTTAIIPNTGTVTINNLVLGKSDRAIKSLTGFVSNDDRSFYWRLTGRQNLEFFAALQGLTSPGTGSRIDELFKLFNVHYAHKRFDSYSTGMKRKFELIRALLHNPDILLLDEPTKSLDLSSSIEFREYICHPSHKQKAMIVATHNFDEAQYLSNRYVILHQGRLLGQGTLTELQQQTGLKSASLSAIYRKLTNNV